MDAARISELIDAFTTIAQQLETGAPLLQALQAAASVTRNPRLRSLFEEMSTTWQTEANILRPLDRHSDLVPRSVFWLLSAGIVSETFPMALEQAIEMLKARRSIVPGGTAPKQFFQRQALFAAGLGRMLQGGVHLVYALEALAAEAEPGPFQDTILSMSAAARLGDSFAPVAACHSDLFSVEFAEAVAQGEAAGTLGVKLLAFSDRLKSQLRQV
jgi:type II secretory pathway component PulF